MTQKSKNKGKSWEREVALYLSNLYNESFIRVPNSGAYIGGKNSSRKEFLHEGQIRSLKGDIIPPHTWSYFNCECKNYADFPFHQLYSGEVKLLESWIRQLKDVADPKDLNILMIKITRKGKYIAVESNLHWDTGKPYTYYISPTHGAWSIFDYDTFFEYNKNLVQKLSTT